MNLLREEQVQKEITALTLANRRRREEKSAKKERRLKTNRNNLIGAHHFHDLVVDEDAKEPEPLTD